MGSASSNDFKPEAKASARLRDVVVVGAGPSGLAFALQVLECMKHTTNNDKRSSI